MKKFSSFVMTALLLLLGAVPAVVGAEEAELAPGTLVKSPSSSAVYYIDEDLTRHVFPNGRIFTSWFENFDGVVEVSDETLAEYPLAGNVPYKPGKLLVKITTDPRTYAVDEGGVLRWIRNERVARALYGDHWNQLVQDLSDAFFVDYQVGDDIEDESEFDTNQGQRIKSLIQTLRSKRLKRLKKRGASDEDLENRGFGRNKIAVCHKFGTDAEHTIYVARPALSAHLNHGDEEGRCAGDTDEQDDGDDEEGEETDTTAPSFISDAIEDIAETSAHVVFEADESVTAMVYSATDTPVDTETASHADSTTLATSHDVVLSGLEPETEYHVVIVIKDAAGNETTSSELSFTTLAEEDTTAPSFLTSSVESATATAATVSFTADEDVTATVYYADASPVDTGTANSVASGPLGRPGAVRLS